MAEVANEPPGPLCGPGTAKVALWEKDSESQFPARSWVVSGRGSSPWESSGSSPGSCSLRGRLRQWKGAGHAQSAGRGCHLQEDWVVCQLQLKTV